MPSKTILVTGDWVADWNLARPANLPEGYFDGSLQTQLVHRAGGAWYVAHLIRNVTCRDLTRSLTATPLRPPEESIPGLNPDGTQRDDLAHAYSVWWKHQRHNSGEREDQVWRIARFAGCRKSTRWKPPEAKKGKHTDQLLVIDDLGLGFSEQPEAVAHVTSHAGNKARILLKHGVRADNSGILSQLLDIGLGDRLHVVASANALRRRNAALSWDRTLEDIEDEFETGASCRDLAKCAVAIVHFGVAGAGVFHRGKLHRFYFLPDELERVWEDDRPGKNFGTGSILTACVARHLISPDDYPLFFAVSQALAAQRAAHDGGAGAKDMNIDLPYGRRTRAADPDENPAAACVAPPKRTDPNDAKHVACVESFRAAWNPEGIQVWSPAIAPELVRKGQPATRSLLCNITGPTHESFRAKGMEIVIQGPKSALASVPKASYGKFLTVDRDEIESINEIRRLILEYQANPQDKRPLSIAVFGTPGSGKSFAVKEVAKAIFGKEKEQFEFNLTQIKTAVDLHRAFHQVRDASIRLEIPLVFWDEFDTAGLKWLADFLAPMQDAEFFDGSHKHPFGKCIFIFAGGTRNTFEEFKRWPSERNETWTPTPEEPWHQDFKALKGPDFISRLRGFLNIEGPNPAALSGGAKPDQCLAHGDPTCVLRRALILRSEIKRFYPHLIDPATDRASISPNVVHAFLSVERYHHGARSITALVSMSALANAKAFTVSCLPACDMLDLHVSTDFKDKLADSVWSEQLLLALARAGHEGYRKGRKRTEPTAPHLKRWKDLDDRGRLDNFDPVPRRLLELQWLGWEIQPKDNAASCDLLSRVNRAGLLNAMLEPEHRIWLSRRLAEGFEKARPTRRWLRLNTDIAPFAEIAVDNKAINIAIMTETLAAFEPVGFCLVRASKTPVKKK